MVFCTRLAASTEEDKQTEEETEAGQEKQPSSNVVETGEKSYLKGDARLKRRSLRFFFSLSIVGISGFIPS